ncbi:hypothetical protein [Maribacter antarcticus]|uniref:hypothetical protein n=1 Tax=Maribacter antarcticus TaxID=505250 RepID=UPI00047CA5A6|nr:hypothetical protein [Maribacter antarcticus]
MSESFPFWKKRFYWARRQWVAQDLPYCKFSCWRSSRLALRIDYDPLDDMCSHHSGLRQPWGIDNCTDFGSDRFIDFGYGRIVDNIRLLDDGTLGLLNEVIVDFGSRDICKKKDAEALSVKAIVTSWSLMSISPPAKTSFGTAPANRWIP